MLLRELLELGQGRDRGPRGDRYAVRGEPFAHEDLVLRVLERGRAGADDVPLGLQHAKVARRHLLVVERDDVASLCEGAQGVQVVHVTDGHVRDDLGGRGVGSLREQAETHTEGDAGLVGHPGELAAAHHAHDRGSGEAHEPRA